MLTIGERSAGQRQHTSAPTLVIHRGKSGTGERVAGLTEDRDDLFAKEGHGAEDHQRDQRSHQRVLDCRRPPLTIHHAESGAGNRRADVAEDLGELVAEEGHGADDDYGDERDHQAVLDGSRSTVGLRSVTEGDECLGHWFVPFDSHSGRPEASLLRRTFCATSLKTRPRKAIDWYGPASHDA